jgi:hypothetical protein
MDFRAVRSREAHVGQHISLGLVHERRELGHPGPGLVGHFAPLLARGGRVVLGEGGADPGGDDPTLGLARLGQCIAHEVHAGAVEKVVRL